MFTQLGHLHSVFCLVQLRFWAFLPVFFIFNVCLTLQIVFRSSCLVDRLNDCYNNICNSCCPGSSMPITVLIPGYISTSDETGLNQHSYTKVHTFFLNFEAVYWTGSNLRVQHSALGYDKTVKPASPRFNSSFTNKLWIFTYWPPSSLRSHPCRWPIKIVLSLHLCACKISPHCFVFNIHSRLWVTGSGKCDLIQLLTRRNHCSRPHTLCLFNKCTKQLHRATPYESSFHDQANVFRTIWETLYGLVTRNLKVRARRPEPVSLIHRPQIQTSNRSQPLSAPAQPQARLSLFGCPRLLIPYIRINLPHLVAVRRSDMTQSKE